METNPITEQDVKIREEIDYALPPTDWTDPNLAQITRLRLLGDRDYPYLDISYCHGVLKDGTPVRVKVPFHLLTKKRWRSQIVEYAKQDGVYAKGLGIFDNISLFI